MKSSNVARFTDKYKVSRKMAEGNTIRLCTTVQKYSIDYLQCSSPDPYFTPSPPPQTTPVLGGDATADAVIAPVISLISGSVAQAIGPSWQAEKQSGSGAPSEGRWHGRNFPSQETAGPNNDPRFVTEGGVWGVWGGGVSQPEGRRW